MCSNKCRKIYHPTLVSIHILLKDFCSIHILRLPWVRSCFCSGQRFRPMRPCYQVIVVLQLQTSVSSEHEPCHRFPRSLVQTTNHTRVASLSTNFGCSSRFLRQRRIDGTMSRSFEWSVNNTCSFPGKSWYGLVASDRTGFIAGYIELFSCVKPAETSWVCEHVSRHCLCNRIYESTTKLGFIKFPPVSRQGDGKRNACSVVLVRSQVFLWSRILPYVSVGAFHAQCTAKFGHQLQTHPWRLVQTFRANNHKDHFWFLLQKHKSNNDMKRST